MPTNPFATRRLRSAIARRIALASCASLAVGAAFADETRLPAPSAAMMAETPPPTRGEAEAAYREGRHHEAFAAWSKAAAAAPQDARAWLRLGNLWQRAGDLQRASQAYRTALEGQPEEARARAALNLALLGLAQAGGALRSLDAQRLPIELRPLARLLDQQLEAARAAADAIAPAAGMSATAAATAPPAMLGAP